MERLEYITPSIVNIFGDGKKYYSIALEYGHDIFPIFMGGYGVQIIGKNSIAVETFVNHLKDSIASIA